MVSLPEVANLEEEDEIHKEEEICKKNNHEEKACSKKDMPQCYIEKGLDMSKRIVALTINNTIHLLK